MKSKKISVILLLLFVTCIAAFFSLRSRAEAPKGSLTVVAGEKSVTLDPFAGTLVSVKGTVPNGKGETKTVDETGVPLRDVLLAAGVDADPFQSLRVVSSDEYAAELTSAEAAEEGKAYLVRQEENNQELSVRLIVFGDNNSKRQVKNVKRVELVYE